MREGSGLNCQDPAGRQRQHALEKVDLVRGSDECPSSARWFAQQAGDRRCDDAKTRTKSGKGTVHLGGVAVFLLVVIALTNRGGSRT